LLPVLALVALAAGGWLLLDRGQEPEPAPPPVAAPEPAPQASPEESGNLATIRAETDPARALQLANDGHYQFPQGGLYPDREVIAIRSLLRLQRQDEAKGRAQRFLQRFPAHPQAPLVRRMAGL
jgi:hypothetical protein